MDSTMDTRLKALHFAKEWVGKEVSLLTDSSRPELADIANIITECADIFEEYLLHGRVIKFKSSD